MYTYSYMDTWQILWAMFMFENVRWADFGTLGRQLLDDPTNGENAQLSWRFGDTDCWTADDDDDDDDDDDQPPNSWRDLPRCAMVNSS